MTEKPTQGVLRRGGRERYVLPEPYATSLNSGRPGDVCDAPAASPVELFGRALARLRLGRAQEAGADFQAALPFLEDPCRLELAGLDLGTGRSAAEAEKTAADVLTRAPEASELRARALHVLGAALAKRDEKEEAMPILLEALEMYRVLGLGLGRAHVQDTLGTIHAAQGNLELAVSWFAASLAEKVFCGDRYGMGISLGNLGRAHLRAGRQRMALDFFDMDYKIATELGDAKGQVRMLNDMGRAYLGLGDHVRAGWILLKALRTARGQGYADLEFLVRKDFALVLGRAGKAKKGFRQLEKAATLIEGNRDPYYLAILEAARGELALQQNAPDALPVLEAATRKFSEIDLPDYEIPLRMTLARAYSRARLKGMAESCLDTALERARRGHYERYLRQIREEMTELGCSSGLTEESGRFSGSSLRQHLPGDYVVLERLGAGEFGEVYRAYDPLRDQFVALKFVSLCRVYDLKRRDELMTSARMELEVASRIRHPGVARIFAIGHGDDGDCYVVGEYIKGRTLRSLMEAFPKPDCQAVLDKAKLVASALHALHSQGVVHRDVKPENIILRAPEDAPVLVDFGVAFVPDFEGGFPADQIAGTLPYIAPEVLRGTPADCRADMYSLGVILFQWLSGELPWRLSGKDWNAMVSEKLHVPPPSLDCMRNDLIRQFALMVDRLLDSDPEKRPSAEEMASSLESLDYHVQCQDALRDLKTSRLLETALKDSWGVVADR